MENRSQPLKPVRIEYVTEGTIAAIKAANRKAAELLPQEEKEKFGFLGITPDARMVFGEDIADLEESSQHA